MLTPDKFDPNRHQNSVMLLRKAVFPGGAAEDVTGKVLEKVHGGKLELGDLFAVSTVDSAGNKLLLGSFHGDTDGLMTLPTVRAMDAVCREMPGYSLIMGLDANTYHNHSEGKKQGVFEFYKACEALGFHSCFHGVASNTTFKARTSLQPQFNKAVKHSEMLESPFTDKNPKDHILFSRDKWEARECVKDNTGNESYDEGIVLPTIGFPSDHSIVRATLVLQGK